MENLFEHAKQVIEAGIAQLGLNLEECRGRNPYEWILTRGSAKIYVIVKSNDEGVLIVILSPIMLLPENNQKELALELLRLNHLFVGVSFTLYENVICAASLRYVEGLDVKEFLDLLNFQSSVADHFDDILIEKYQGIKVTDIS